MGILSVNECRVLDHGALSVRRVVRRVVRQLLVFVLENVMSVLDRQNAAARHCDRFDLLDLLDILIQVMMFQTR